MDISLDKNRCSQVYLENTESRKFGIRNPNPNESNVNPVALTQIAANRLLQLLQLKLDSSIGVVVAHQRSRV